MFSALLGAGSALRAQPTPAAPIKLGHATVALNGPWRFSTGDDLRRASPDFDDSAWERVDLTPAPGSHDGDVGLPGYVVGWGKRGHAGYSGYAWYRIKVSIDDDTRAALALAGPTLVDSTYQIYVDGKLAGGPGVFSANSATAYSVRPSVYPLPASSTPGPQTHLIALRVWMDALDAGDESGGIHIAPTIGRADDIERLHQVQWLKTFNGYVADALEPLAFVVLAIMVLGLVACRSGDSYRWLIAALLLLALLRVNQVTYAWTHWQSLRNYDFATGVLIKPLALSAWVLAWRDWFRLAAHPRLRHLPALLAVLSAIYLLAALLGRPWLLPGAPHALRAAADVVVQGVRLVYISLYLWMIGQGLLRPKPSRWLAVLAALLVGIGLFATELNALGIPGIWFPWGVGVARGQYAYAGFIVLFFALVLMRFVEHARRSRLG